MTDDPSKPWLEHGADNSTAPEMKPFGQTGTTSQATPVQEGESILDGTTAETVQDTAVTKPAGTVLPGEAAPATAGKASSQEPASQEAASAAGTSASEAAREETLQTTAGMPASNINPFDES